MVTFGRYELRDRLGRGGFATVYRAWDPRLGREVALKALSLDMAEEPELRRRFLAEAQTLARLHHPHIVTVFDVEDSPERPFFTMELIEGQTLFDYLAGGIRLEPAAVLTLITPLASALDALHASGLVHRDIKAANVMLERTGRVVLMDLGIARQLEGPQYTSRSMVVLSPESAAPEQITGRPVSAATDNYALGVLTYQLLAGRPPFVGDTAALLYAHAHQPPPPLWELRPGLPSSVYAAIGRALAKDPVERPASAGEFVALLQGAPAAGGSLPTIPYPTPAPRPFEPKPPATRPPEATLAAMPETGAGDRPRQEVQPRKDSPVGAAISARTRGLVAGCAAVAAAGALLPWLRGESGIKSSGIVRALLPVTSDHSPFALFEPAAVGDGWFVLLVASLIVALVLTRRLPLVWLAGFAVINLLCLPTIFALFLFSFGNLSGNVAPLTDAWGLFVVVSASLAGGALTLRAIPPAHQRLAWVLAALSLLLPLLPAIVYYQHYWG